MLKLLVGYIDLIQDDGIKNLVKTLFADKQVQMCMEHASTYSGHNHPEDEFCKFGQLKHTLRVCNIAIQLYRSIPGATSIDYDIIIASSLLHDVPYKFSFETGYTELNHAVLNAKWFYMKTEQLNFKGEVRDKITSCILNHMGKWETSRDSLFDTFTPDQYTWAVHLADSISSRKNVIIDISDLNYIKENLN